MTCVEGDWGPIAEALTSDSPLDRVALLGSQLVFATNANSRISWVCSASEQLLGWSSADLVGTVFIDLVHPDDLQVFAPETAQVRRSLAAGSRGRDDDTTNIPVLRVRCRDGHYRWMLVRIRPTWIEQAEGDVSVLQDVDTVMRRCVQIEARVRRQQAIIDATITPHVLLDADGHSQSLAGVHAIQGANDAAAAYIGATTDRLMGQPAEALFGFLADDSARMAIADVESTRRSRSVQVVEGDLEVHVEPLDGLLFIEWRNRSMPWSEVENLMTSERRYRLLAENISDAMVDVDQGVVLWVSPSVKEMVGWEPQDWIGRRYEDFVHPDDLAVAKEAWEQTGEGRSAIHRFRMRSKDLCYHWVEAHAKPYIDGEVAKGRFVESFRGVDDVVNAERELDRRATTDPLTGLLNRQELINRLSTTTHHSRRSESDTGLLFCDLDNFKSINDQWGHVVGDEVLRQVARVVSDQVRAEDIVARVGGDEVMVSLTHIGGISDALGVAEKVRRAVAIPMQVDGSEVTVTVSIGVALAHSGEDVSQLIGRADKAMYRAKHEGRDRVIAIE